MQDYIISGGLRSIDVRQSIVLNGVTKRASAVIKIVDLNGTIHTAALPLDMVATAVIEAAYSDIPNAKEIILELREARLELIKANAGMAGKTDLLLRNLINYDNSVYDAVVEVLDDAVRCLKNRLFTANGIEYLPGEAIMDLNEYELDIQATKAWIDWRSVEIYDEIITPKIKIVNSRRRVEKSEEPNPKAALQTEYNRLKAEYAAAKASDKPAIKVKMEEIEQKLNAFV